MAVQMQTQVWGDKVFSPITNAVQQERQRQHQKGLADARNALDQQRINNQKSYQDGMLQNQKNLLNMIQLPQAKRQEEIYQQKLTDDAAIDKDTARRGTHRESMRDWKKAQADVTGKFWTPNEMNQWYNPMTWTFGTGKSLGTHTGWGAGGTEEEFRNAISAPMYEPQIDPNVSSAVNRALQNSVRIDQGTHDEDLLNQGGIK
tara:strand:- start:8624 stop:9232 length:609 start_codon:yes stop_codon:yes gene_type:complete